jgi:hypothetical protein
MEEHMLPCMNKQLFGIECPGCGTQRAIAFLLDGEFYEALKIYPAIYTLILFFLVVGLHFVDKSRSYTKWIAPLAIINGIIIISSYLIKMYNQLN